MPELLIPKFLAPEIIKKPLDDMLALLVLNPESPIKSLLHRNMCHVVALAPAMETVGAWPNFATRAVTVYENSIGDMGAWPYHFDEIARCKALQLWQGRNDGGTHIMPHLLYTDDAPFWGGDKRNGIVVACSGFREHVDKLIAGILIDLLISVAHNAWLESADKKKDVCFLT